MHFRTVRMLGIHLVWPILIHLASGEDFKSSIRMLKALEKVKAVRRGDAHWREMMDSVEEAIEALENARSYLFTGQSIVPRISYR